MFASRILRTTHCCRKYKQIPFVKNVNAPAIITRTTPRLVSTLEKESPYRNTLLGKLLNKLPYINVNRSRIVASGYVLYENIADQVNYSDFFELLELPDSFYSWFVVTELHIWMLSVRAMAEGEDGKLLRNYVIQAFWADVIQRAKKLASMNPAARNEQISELNDQLQAALVAYDEGLQSDDTVLAGAVWRRLFQKEDVQPKHLDKLVKYIRQQIYILDRVSNEELFVNKNISFLPLSKVIT